MVVDAPTTTLASVIFVSGIVFIMVFIIVLVRTKIACEAGVFSAVPLQWWELHTGKPLKSAGAGPGQSQKN